MQYFYTIDLLTRNLVKFVSSIMEQYITRYEFLKHFKFFLKKHFLNPFQNQPWKMISAPHAFPLTPRDTTAGPRNQSGPYPSATRGRGSLTDRDLASGEVTGSKAATLGLPSVLRIQQTRRWHQRGISVLSPVRMAE
jgi:hypothetical protein